MSEQKTVVEPIREAWVSMDTRFPKVSLCGMKFQGFSTNHTYYLLRSDIFLPGANNRLQDEAAWGTARGALRHGIGIW